MVGVLSSGWPWGYLLQYTFQKRKGILGWCLSLVKCAFQKRIRCWPLPQVSVGMDRFPSGSTSHSVSHMSAGVVSMHPPGTGRGLSIGHWLLVFSGVRHWLKFFLQVLRERFFRAPSSAAKSFGLFTHTHRTQLQFHALPSLCHAIC